MGGRVSVFRGKDGGVRVQGVLTTTGGAAFELQRKRLEALYKFIMEHPIAASDADVIEYLARGERATEGYLRGLKRRA